MKRIWFLVLMAAVLAIIAGCGGAASQQPTQAPQATTAPAASGGNSATPVKVRLVLQWVTQSQFAGYYAALDKGYYKDEGLDVTIQVGGPDVLPQQVLATGGAEFATSWLPKMLAAREGGAKVVNISQVFQRSGTLEISWKDSNITKPEDLKGKKVATWLGGDEPELFAAMRKAGINPDDKNAVTIVKQPFDMSLLLKKDVDTAEAMTYNEYAQVLEATNPATGQLYSPSDLNVIDFNKVGTAMLQDGIFAREDWLGDATNQDTAVKFLRATNKGWIYCRDNFDDCVNIVLKNGPTLGKGHMTWMLNEINALIWPSPNGVGMLDQSAYDQTVQIAKTYGVLKNAPDPGATRTDLAKKALDSMTGVDTKGLNYQKQTVQITKGGE